MRSLRPFDNRHRLARSAVEGDHRGRTGRRRSLRPAETAQPLAVEVHDRRPVRGRRQVPANEGAAIEQVVAMRCSLVCSVLPEQLGPGRPLAPARYLPKRGQGHEIPLAIAHGGPLNGGLNGSTSTWLKHASVGGRNTNDARVPSSLCVPVGRRSAPGRVWTRGQAGYNPLSRTSSSSGGHPPATGLPSASRAMPRAGPEPVRGPHPGARGAGS